MSVPIDNPAIIELQNKVAALTLQASAPGSVNRYLDKNSKDIIQEISQAGFTFSDGTTSVSPVSNIIFTGATVTNNGDGAVGISITGGGAPGGVDTNIQFNNSSAFGGDNNLEWGTASKTLFISGGGVIGPHSKSGAGDNLSVESGNSSGANGSGGTLLLQSGSANGTGGGGTITILASNGGATNGTGGEIDITAGNGVGTGEGGDVQILAGNTTSTNIAGKILLQAGVSDSGKGSGAEIDLRGGLGNGTGGNVELRGGDTTETGTDGGDIVVIPGFMTSGGKNGRFHLANTGGSVGTFRVSGTQTTTNNSYVSVPDSFAMATNSSGYISARVVGRRTGGSAGTANDSFAAEIAVGTKCVAGTASLQTSITTVYLFGDNAVVDTKFVVSGASVFLQVKGDTNNNYDFSYEIYYMSVT